MRRKIKMYTHKFLCCSLKVLNLLLFGELLDLRAMDRSLTFFGGALFGLRWTRS